MLTEGPFRQSIISSERCWGRGKGEERDYRGLGGAGWVVWLCCFLDVLARVLSWGVVVWRVWGDCA